LQTVSIVGTGESEFCGEGGFNPFVARPEFVALAFHPALKITRTTNRAPTNLTLS